MHFFGCRFSPLLFHFGVALLCSKFVPCIYIPKMLNFITQSAFRPRYHRISIKSLLMRLRSFHFMYTRARLQTTSVRIIITMTFHLFLLISFYFHITALLGCTGAHKHMHTHIGSVIINKLTCMEMPNRAVPCPVCVCILFCGCCDAKTIKNQIHLQH